MADRGRYGGPRKVCGKVGRFMYLRGAGRQISRADCMGSANIQLTRRWGSAADGRKDMYGFQFKDVTYGQEAAGWVDGVYYPRTPRINDGSSFL